MTPPALPAGWTATNDQGPPPLWVTSNSGMPTPPFDTPPNAAFVDNPQVVSDKRLESPSIPIETSAAQLTFRNNYYTENTFDGGVLEISINGGAFQDILAAGGRLVVGTYSGTLQTGLENPLSGRLAWTGNSNNGFITTVAILPPPPPDRTSCCAGARAPTPASGLPAGASTRSRSASASVHRRRLHHPRRHLRPTAASSSTTPATRRRRPLHRRCARRDRPR